MNNSDLADLRALLRAAAEERRPQPRGPLRRLRGLLGAEQAEPLLSPPVYTPRPAPRPKVVVDVTDDEPLLLNQPFLPSPRRRAFGQRPEPGAEPARPAAPVVVLHSIDDDDVAEAIRRVRSPRLRRIDEVIEAPFLPEDLADHAEEDVERVYASAPLVTAGPAAPPVAPQPPAARAAASPPPVLTVLSAAQSMLLGLEQRLLAEHMGLIRIIAGV